MKKATQSLLILLAVAHFSALADGAETLIDRLNSPDFETRVRATNEMGEYMAAEFQKAAALISKGGPVPSDWPAVREAIERRAEADGIAALRKTIGEIGGETEHRFQSLDVLRESAVRKAALAAGLEAPGDFEVGLIADSIASAPPPVHFEPELLFAAGGAVLGRR